MVVDKRMIDMDWDEKGYIDYSSRFDKVCLVNHHYYLHGVCVDSQIDSLAEQYYLQKRQEDKDRHNPLYIYLGLLFFLPLPTAIATLIVIGLIVWGIRHLIKSREDAKLKEALKTHTDRGNNIISHISGKIKKEEGLNVVIDVNGKVCKVLVPPAIMKEIEKAKSADGNISLVTYHYYQIDQSKATTVLIGFLSETEKEFFEQFITVSGIGPKAACRAITLTIPEIAMAIDKGNMAILQSLPGINEQKAREIITKLQGKVGQFWQEQSSQAQEETRESKKHHPYRTKSKNKESYYEILNISENASAEEIKKAYCKKMLEYHPDRIGGLGEKLKDLATEEAKKINRAFEELMKSKGVST